MKFGIENKAQPNVSLKPSLAKLALCKARLSSVVIASVVVI
jgi:hypothetical protein